MNPIALIVLSFRETYNVILNQIRQPSFLEITASSMSKFTNSPYPKTKRYQISFFFIYITKTRLTLGHYTIYNKKV